MRILITGAAGFLGLNLLKQIAEAHPEAAIIATDSEHSLPDNHAKFDQTAARCVYQPLDVRNAFACKELLQRAQPTHIAHAAAVTFPDDSAPSIEATSAVNLDGTRNILDAATLVGTVQRVLLLSSSGLYDQSADGSACDESHPLDLSLAYARTKRQAEMFMEEYECRGGFTVLAARIGPVYGEFERTRLSRPNISMIQSLVDHLVAKQLVQVRGTDMHRDWTHAADISRALELLLFAPKLRHRLYNVSSGVSVTARTIIDLFIEQGLSVIWVDGAEPADLAFGPGQNRKPLVIERLKKDTGFEPSFDIRRGVAQVIASCQQHTKIIDLEETAAK